MKIRGFVRLLGVGFLKNEENLNLTVSCETPAFKKRGMFQLFHAVKNATEEKYSDPVPMANGKKICLHAKHKHAQTIVVY